MADPITIEGVEEAASRLTPREQLRLLANLSARLSETAFASESTAANGQPSYAARVQAFMEMCRTSPARQSGPADAASDIRESRDLQAEFDALERASDENLAHFESR